MKQKNIKRRNDKICEDWQKHKNDWDMSDIAEIYSISLKSVYRVIKESNKKDPDRFIRKHIMRSHRKITKKI